MIKVIFLTLISWTSPSAPMDSLRLETINGKQFIIHRIEERETLYSISRRYGVPITSILESNPTADGGLAIGQLLKVPYVPRSKPQTQVLSSGERRHTVAAKETLYSIARLYEVSTEDIKAWNSMKDNSVSIGQVLIIKKKSNELPAAEITKTPEPKSISAIHTVASGESMYGIARKYNVTVQQLQQWNGLTGTDVKVGQTLFITQPMYNKPTETKVAETKTVEVKTATQPVRPEVKATTESITISEKVIGSDEIREAGLAELIEGSEGNRKYLGLHRTAPVGTILKVRNELNNREVFVRVAGPLPNTGINNNVVIKISKSAYDRLGAIDQKFRVEVTYYK
jgi:LysM repeat protein